MQGRVGVGDSVHVGAELDGQPDRFDPAAHRGAHIVVLALREIDLRGVHLAVAAVTAGSDDAE